MTTAKRLSVDKDELQQLGLKAIQDYFKVNASQLKPDTLRHLHQKAKLGMTFERESNLSKRAVEGNYIRVFRLIAQDKTELKRLVTRSLPNYFTA